ncbi:SIR2 family protein [Microbacterium esteraromaticum]|uniref:SIR2 family NAD-dependent protein deacylase n=1 Tax=Microbacterium esteraromaticum TaxID=57043 RepID=UPI001C9404EB|nr:SIR2 family protein [Microbacterium esteraromaticum]MBY6059850.1 SIR2 family protein [Microbacterium esteraromaticum]
MTGHVFVIQGDIRRFACDAYMFATDKRLRDGGGWMTSAPGAPDRLDPSLVDDFKSERRFTLPLVDRPGRNDEPITILTAVPYYGVKTEKEFVPRLEEFFRVGAELAAHRTLPRELTKREKVLLAVPLFGVGGGGAGRIRGDVFRLVYAESRAAAARYDVDVAIVLRDPRDYALAQMIRREMPDAWAELDGSQVEDAQRLGAIASEARLVPFMGAGISVSAGAPSWQELISSLASAAGVTSEVREKLRKHDVLDQAAYVRQEFERRFRGEHDEFARAIIQAVDMRRYGLSPAMLAALEAEQAITLNYDRLFEWAAHDGQRPRRVIPGHSDSAERWLLKLHGSVDSPASIVLTRDDYLGFNADRAALSSLVKATLMTRHLLFVGFGVKDPHFHEIVHDVRRAIPDKGVPFGTVITLSDDEVLRALWKHDLEFVHLPNARILDIFLDAVLAYGASSHAYLLSKGYLSTLSPEDRVVANALNEMIVAVPESLHMGATWAVVEKMLHGLGWMAEASKRSWPALPEGLD